MIKVSDKKAIHTCPKHIISVEGVSIKDGKFVDEDGDIVESVKSALLDTSLPFTLKITIDCSEDNTDGSDE